MSGQNLNVVEIAQALRPNLAGLLIQQIAPLNEALPVITLSSELEHMLISISNQSADGNLLLDANLAQRLIKSISEASEKSMADGRQAVMIVAPQVRRQLSLLLDTTSTICLSLVLLNYQTIAKLTSLLPSATTVIPN